MKYSYKLSLFILLLITNVNIVLGSELIVKVNEDCVQPIIAPSGILFLTGTNNIVLSVGSTFSRYQWLKNDVKIEGATEATLKVATAGRYKIITNEGLNCEKISDVKEIIDVKNNDPLPFENLVVTNGIKTDDGFILCEGETIIITAQGNFAGYVWSGGVNNLTASVSISEAGTYQVAARLTQDCALTQTFTVTGYDAPSVLIEASDSEFGDGESISLYASGASQFQWSPEEGLDNPNIANPTASPGRTITYTVTGTAINGCTNSKEVTLTLNSSKITIFPPKVFSANREAFYVIDNIEDYPNLEMVIFNRMGLEVFKAKPYLNNWDGIFRGSLLPKGDYYFVMRGQGNKNLKTGSILLLR